MNRVERNAGVASGVLSALANLIWPPRSLVSDQIVSRPGGIEADAWSRLAFLHEPVCDACGFPLPAFVGEGAVCGACAAHRPVFDRARAALAYDDAAREMVLQIKRAGRRDGLPTVANWMAHAAADLIADADVIAPVPLHWRRLSARGFNQAAWLAQALSARCGLRWRPALLSRPKKPGGQGGLSRSERERQVAGAFRASPKAKDLRVLLVDDVITTGATANACARALFKAGAKKVHVGALARVVRGADASI